MICVLNRQMTDRKAIVRATLDRDCMADKMK